MGMLRFGTVNKYSSRTVGFILKDQAGVVVPLSAIDSATLTYYDKLTYNPNVSPAAGIINGRDAQNVKNANNVEIHPTTGQVTWVLQGDVDGDATNATPRRQVERKIMKFAFIVGGAELTQDGEIIVRNI